MKNRWLAAAAASRKLSSNAKLVCLVMWQHARLDGSNVYPAQSRVAVLSGLSVKSVQRAINELERHSWLQRDGTQPSGRGRPVVRYKLSQPVE